MESTKKTTEDKNQFQSQLITQI
jgi:hypothetical protein